MWQPCFVYNHMIVIFQIRYILVDHFFVILQVPASPGSSASSLTIVTAISSNSDSTNR